MRLSMSAIVSDAARTTPPEVTIVVPTYNECERLDTLIEQVFASCDGRVSVEVIVVDDNSPDGTGAKAECLAAGRALRVIRRRGGCDRRRLEPPAVADSHTVRRAARSRARHGRRQPLRRRRQERGICVV